MTRSVALGLASVLGLSGCNGDPGGGDDGRAHFVETGQIYEIRSLGAHMDQFDERVSFGSLADILVTPNGYFVADGLNGRIVLLDRSLNPVRISGRDGDGPGEYRFPSRMDYASERIPDELRPDPEGPFQLRMDLVTVSDDGLIHVLDQDQIALVSFDTDGTLMSVLFLPKEIRDLRLRENRETIEVLGGPERVLGTQFVSSLRPVEDGRLFARITSENTIGLFLNVKRHEAARLAVPAEREDWLWMLSSGVYLDGMNRAVLTEGLKAAGLLTANIELTDPGG